MFRIVAAVTLCMVFAACGAPAPPPHHVVGQQGIVRFVVVSSESAAQDQLLWQIADDLRRDTAGQAVQAMFWTNDADAARSLPLSDRAMATMVAQIDINPATGHRALTRLARKP